MTLDKRQTSVENKQIFNTLGKHDINFTRADKKTKMSFK